MKVHLVSAPQPLSYYPDTSAANSVCGQLIDRAEIVMVWDEQVIGAEPMLSAVCFCRKCIEIAHEEHLVKTERRYLYGVVKGQPYE
jgi:hypothetical protein